MSGIKPFWLNSKQQPQGSKEGALLGVRSCHHVAEPVSVAGNTVYATSLMDSKVGASTTEAGVFLADEWGHARIPRISIVVRWPDMGVLPLYEYRTLVHVGMSLLDRFKQLSIGCLGAHGRTGTYLAGLLVVGEGLTAVEAIKETRRRLCSRCIESNKQIQLIQSLAKHKGV